MDGTQFSDRHAQQDVTLGEVYRKLCAVHDQTIAINGRVTRHDAAIAVLQWATGLIGVTALAIFAAMLAKGW